ncbi:MAG: short chain dehydrogenase [Planctomycetaceae bacterium]|nr:short chain dehydrogenase [Planctomycetaceae bacterium]
MSIANDAVLLITGASSGIGAATARLLAAPGRILHLQGRDRPRLAEVERDLQATGAEVLTHPLDLEDRAAVDDAAAALASSIPRLDVLVHSAGMISLNAVGDASIADLDRQYAVNLRAPFALTTALTPALIAARGQAVFVNSGAGLRAGPAWSQYAATKFGLRAMADAYRAEVESDGVRVTTVYPGRTATPMQAEVHRFEGREYDESAFARPEDVASSIIHALDMPRSAIVPEVMVR